MSRVGTTGLASLALSPDRSKVVGIRLVGDEDLPAGPELPALEIVQYDLSDFRATIGGD